MLPHLWWSANSTGNGVEEILVLRSTIMRKFLLHHFRYCRRNFGVALDDYAKGCPKAPIILVNYGPTDPSILTLVDPSRRERTFLVGDFKPLEENALNYFRDLVRGAYPTVLRP